ncbi:MAG: hypothetical protein AAGA96_12910 [Verrucomicrobiota bacterium]
MPIVHALVVISVKSSSRLISSLCLAAGVLIGAHVIWYFQSLGISLSDKVGDAVYPKWSTYMVVAAVAATVVVWVRQSFSIRRSSPDLITED